jgi:hypothetical protein
VIPRRSAGVGSVNGRRVRLPRLADRLLG